MIDQSHNNKPLRSTHHVKFPVKQIDFRPLALAEVLPLARTPTAGWSAAGETTVESDRSRRLIRRAGGGPASLAGAGRPRRATRPLSSGRPAPPLSRGTVAR